MDHPEVSVVIATYNHAPFVEAAVRSVLEQKGISFELLIADDGSSDGTADVVSRIGDARLDFVAHSRNRGACVVTNELIQKARGKYVAVMNSDDVWLSDDKLAHQVQILRSAPELAATFGRVRFIDREGHPIKAVDLPFGTVFDQPNRSQGEWLRRFFYEGNCLCHPSVLIRRSCYVELGLYDNRYRQLPDFDMWIRLVKAHPIHVSDRVMVGFRILPGENASAQTPTNAYRTINEHYFIAQKFFDGMPPALFAAGFGVLTRNADAVEPVALRIEQSLLLLETDVGGLSVPYKLLALQQINDLLGDPKARQVLAADYRIDDRWLHEAAGRNSTLRPDMAQAAAMAPLQTRLSEAEAELEALRSQLAEHSKTEVLVRGDLQRAGEAVDLATAEAAKAHASLHAIESSKSWKLTSPIRTLSRLAARLR